MKPFKQTVVVGVTKLDVTIKRNNAAFEDCHNETQRILNTLIGRVSGSELGDQYNLFDYNGNRVGEAIVSGFTVSY